MLNIYSSASANLGVAKEAIKIGRQITFNLYLENLSATTQASSISLNDDLDAVFGAGNYTVISTVNQTSGPNTLTLNGLYDGSADTELITTGTLESGEIAVVSFIVNIDMITDQGSGLGFYSNQANITSNFGMDDSQNGNDPDPDGNGDPTDMGNNEPTLIDIPAQPRIGLAKAVNTNGTSLTFTLTLENLGNRTLQNFILNDELDNVFGAGNYLVTSPPSFIDDPDTMTLNALFDGATEANLIASGTLVQNDTAQIEFVVDVTNVTDQGSGFGVYINQASVNAQTTLLELATDLSDQGLFIDPNNNGNANEDGENDPTTIVIGDEPVIGLAKDISVTGNSVTIDFYLENLGNTDLFTLSLIDDLNNVLGLGNYFVDTGPSFIDNPGTITLNNSYDGNFDIELFNSENSSLIVGETAQVRMVVQLIDLSDQGLGLGVYENQALVSADSSNGVMSLDFSDNGSDPDTNGNGNPNEAGENDFTPFTIAPVDEIGISKEYINAGVTGGFSTVDLIFTVTNYGNQMLSDITIDDDLDAVYGAGNYLHLIDPELVSGINTLMFNPAFNGSANTAMVTGGTLAPAQSTSFKIRHLILTPTDQGFGIGVYQNQVTVNATAPDTSPLSDVSHEGNDPDPNSDNNPNEMDPTVIDINQIASIGVAIDVNVAGNTITLDYYFENLSNIIVNELAIRQDLNAVFSEGNYTITTPPFFVNDPGTITLNGSYNGDDSTDFIDVLNSSLTTGALSQIQMVVEVTTITNIGLGIGNYSIQGTLDGMGGNGQMVTDTSDFGLDPDPNGNGDANEAGENDATTFSINASTLIGVALNSIVMGNNITYDINLENFGADTVSSLSLVESLDNTFGIGNYQITSIPSLIVDPGTLILNNSFDGSENTGILDASSTLAAGAVAQIQLTIQVNTESDQGSGFGIYTNQVELTGSLPSGVNVSDLSDDGVDPDPNGNGDASDAGENDLTTSIISGNPSIGVAYNATVTGNQVTMDFTVENLGNSTLTNVIIQNPLNPVFGASNYNILGQPLRVSGASTLLLSPQYFGFNIFDVMVAGGFLRPGESETFRVIVTVTTVSDQGNGFGVYLNGVTVNATDPGGTLVSDISDDGIDPDPNGNGNAGNAGEDDQTIITIGDEANIGLAIDVNISGQTATIDYYIENFGGSLLSTFNLPINLDTIFGAGNYIINTAPTLIDDPGTITLNGGFNGSADTTLILGGSTLAALDTAQIRFVIDVTTVVDIGIGFGQYSLQSTINANTPLGTVAIDVSDNGTDPDPNGNNIANDADESDPSVFSIGFSSVGLAKSVTVDPLDSTQSTFVVSLAVENLGLVTLNGIQVTDNLDSVFGATNYTVTSPPDFFGDGRDLVANANFNGSSDLNIFDPLNLGSLPAGTLITVRFSVKVNEVIDQGSGLGNYVNQATVTVNSPSLIDLSDDGVDPDPNGDGLSDGLGEDDPSVFGIPSASPPTFTMAFAPVSIVINGISQLTYTIDNSDSAFNLDSLAFSNNLPPGMVAATPSGVTNSCSGTVTAVDGSSVVTLNNGTLAFDSSCQIRLNITASIGGAFINTTSDLTSSAGNSGTASASLFVDAPAVITPSANVMLEATAPLTTAALGVATVVDDVDVGLVATADNLGPYPVGLTTVTWSVTDSVGNMSSVQQTVTITDTTPPVISLMGSSTINLDAGDLYNEPGATATDLVDDDAILTSNIIISGVVNTNIDGIYTLDYDVTDSTGNNAMTVSRTIIVTDNAPVITAPANIMAEATAPLTPVNIGTATVTDDLDVGLVAVANNLGPYPLGSTTVTWSVMDSAGNTASALQIVTIADTTSPVISLIGASIINLDLGDTYNELGAMATDLVDDDVTLTGMIAITGIVDTGVASTYTVNYDVTDSSSNIAMTVSRLVIVADNPPVVTAPANVMVEATAPLTPVAIGTATVVDDNDIGLVAIADNLGPYPVGVTIVTWNVTDSAGNMASDQQMVTVTDTTIPVISLIGNSTINLFVGDTYNELGAMATDLVDDDAVLTGMILISGTVDTNTASTYTLTYNVADAAGNNALPVTRMVIVSLVPTHTVGGQLNGLLTGNNLTLQNNATDNLVLITDGAFTFVTAIEDNNNYDVTILAQPVNQFCTVTNGQGVINGANITDVSISCTDITLTLDISSINFGEVFIASNNNQTVTITNSASASSSGGTNGNINTDILITGFNNPIDPFSIEGGSCTQVPATLAAGESCTLIVAFNPRQAGNFTGSLEILSNAVSSPDVISLSGAVTIVMIPTLSNLSLAVLALLFLFSFYYLQRKNSSL